ncbi:hypothetical protein C2G38_2233584 [Gigaspora rosea]|uniref:Uncharacterized protein n=1 Tax=Gigaspora rosea TaxID=44941 RepID=A0A397U0N4_9GLOM|nr:hypothetical protein C2G38_2233584 [Gigaspora rosea]
MRSRIWELSGFKILLEFKDLGFDQDLGMIEIRYCTKQSDKKIDDSNYINNMLISGQENKKNELWGVVIIVTTDIAESFIN